MKNNENEINKNESKICNDCEINKKLSYFCLNKNSKDGRNKRCKECANIRNKQHYKNNFDYFKKYRTEYNQKYKDLQTKRGKENYKNNREKCLEQGKEYHIKNQRKIQNRRTIQKRERYHKDPIFKLQINLRTRVCTFLKKENKSKTTQELLGCTWEELKLHLEQQFLPEMNWKNHGEIWEIDHIKALSNFNLLIKEEQCEAFKYTNLRPLFKTSDIAKSFGYIDIIGNRNKGNKEL